MVALKKNKRDGSLAYWLLTLPAVILSICIIVVPGIVTFYAAFTKWNGMSQMSWIGLENFRELFNDAIFWKALKNNFIWTVIFVTVPVALGLISSVLLVFLKRGRNFFQVSYLIPYIIAPTTNAVIWMSIIFSHVSGIIGYLRNLGYEISSPLANMSTALVGVAAVDIWHYWGFLCVVYLAALRQTPDDQIESARIAGANAWQIFRYVYFPNILPTFSLMLVIIVIYSFKTFDYVYLLTSGGPAHASEMLSTLAYTLAFSTFQFGKAAAVSLVMGFFGIAAAFVYTWMSRKEVAE